jgi:hypothetical protein
MTVLCDYCGYRADLVTGKAIYPHRPDLAGKLFYRCLPCKAYVGCRPGTCRPLGRLADAELRLAKTAAHQAFDPLWRFGDMSRSDAYKWLAKRMNIPPAQCHIGMFDVAQCQEVKTQVMSRDFSDTLQGEW